MQKYFMKLEGNQETELLKGDWWLAFRQHAGGRQGGCSFLE